MDNRGKTVLLVEDEILIAMAETQIIKGFGYTVVTAHSGEKAVEIATGDSKINLILMDIDLGKGIDGPEAARRILEKRTLPIVFLTSHAEKEYVDKVREITRYGYVIKNSGNFVLRTSIETAFELFESHTIARERESALAKNLSLLNEMGKMAKIGGWEFDVEKQKLHWTDECYAIYEVDSSFIPTVENVLAFYAPQSRNLLMRKIQGVMDTEDSYEIVAEIVTAKGNRRWVRSIGRAEVKNGKITHRVGVTQDITEQKRMEEAGRESEVRYTSLFNSIQDAIIIVNQERQIVDCNPAFTDLFGYSREEIMGRKTSLLFVSEEEYKKIGRSMRDAGTSGNLLFQVRYRKKSGEVFLGEKRLQHLTDIQGRPDGFIGLIRDITEREKIEESLRNNEEKFHQLFAAVSDALFLIDNETGQIYEVNSSAVNMYGYSREELLTKRNVDMSAEPDSTRQATIDRKNLVPLRWHKKKDGTVFPVEISASHFVWNEKPVHIAAIRDVSFRREAEEKIVTLLEEKDLLLKEVQHRIKNNMNTMMSLLSLQANEMKNPAAEAALKDAQNRFRSMGMLYDRLYKTENLRDMSVDAYLPPLVNEIVRLFPSRAGVKLELRVDDFILGVKELSALGMILNELLTNTMKHAFAGKTEGLITICATKTGGRVRIEVGDDGIGIPESVDLENSFGFGLRLVKTLTRQLGGTIRLERDGGTRFILEFDKE